MTTTYGFKAMKPNMTCRNFQFEVGKTYKVDNDKPLELCSDAGFHFCLNFEDVFNYYNWPTSRVFKIKTEAKVLTEDNKSITKEITILEEVTKQDIDFKKLKTDKAKNFYEIFLEDNEEIIFNKFKNNADWKVRRAVIKNLSDEKLIYSFKDDKYWDIREALVKKLSDEQLIFNTFKDDVAWNVRLAVVKKLSEEKLIYSFKDDEHWCVRLAVIEKLSDEQLIYFFKDDKYWEVREAVVQKLSDEQLIYSFKDDKYWKVRLAVVQKLSDEQFIYSFKDDEDWDIRKAVIGKLEAPRSPY